MNNWDYAAKIATSEGHRQGGFEWWRRIREVLKERNISQSKELEEVELSDFDLRGYRVLDTNKGEEMEGMCAQFKYKSRVISFSTHYPNEASVAVINPRIGNGAECMHKSVEEAIKYVDELE